VEVDDGLLQYIADLTIASGRDPRGLDGVIKDLTETAVSEATDLGLPATGVRLRISLKDQNILVQQLENDSVKVTYELPVSQLLRFNCSDLLAARGA
jgi:hypothetical protein